MKLIKSALNKLGQKIKTERKSQKLSQSELANLADVSLNFISQLESGKETVQMNKVLQVLHTLGLQFYIEYGKHGITYE